MSAAVEAWCPGCGEWREMTHTHGEQAARRVDLISVFLMTVISLPAVPLAYTDALRPELGALAAAQDRWLSQPIPHTTAGIARLSIQIPYDGRLELADSPAGPWVPVAFVKAGEGWVVPTRCWRVTTTATAGGR